MLFSVFLIASSVEARGKETETTGNNRARVWFKRITIPKCDPSIVVMPKKPDFTIFAI